ncbi:MAG TPA: HAMP domain-containing histidine kinase [Candidatus Blautia stercoravium]|nr:HAMP domain-containing histidine kinase [Candidatus Blautia stercoravium]
MKKLSLKIKVTLMFTFFMTLLTCISLGLLFSLSNQEILGSVQAQLEKRVYESMDEVSVQNGRLDIQQDFYDLEDGIYLALYDETGTFLFGRVPYGFQEKAEFADGNMQTVGTGTARWYVFDIKYRPGEFQDVYIRGICSINRAENSVKTVQRLALILLPLLVVFTGTVGYFFTGWTLRPVKRITETVQKIQKDGDLSRRIGLGPGTDEVYVMAETFDKMLVQIEDGFEREKRFTSDVSHELRMPAAVILTQCEEMLEDEKLTKEQKTQLQRIQKKASEMSDMISRLLFLSRADQGRQEIQKERVNLSELTEMAALEMELLADKENIRLEMQIEENLFAEVDESLYIRMVVNLISNAIAYHGGPGYVKIRLQSMENKILGSIEDDGKGISSEDLPHIWERFYRADKARTQDSHSGLGLPMVKWIAEVHQGGIRAESCLGKGSVFTFWLPVEKSGGN